MAVQDIQTYSYKNNFSLSTVQFEKACVVNKPEQLEQYSIFWIKKGKGEYHIDFEHYPFEDNTLFFLSPGQVFAIDSEKIQEAYKISFNQDFYCIQTHDKEVSCNGVLFNNLYETPFVSPTTLEALKLDTILNGLIEEFQLNETAQYDMLQAYLKQFIVSAVRIKKDRSPLKDDTTSTLFKEFSVLVEMNYTKLHAVTDYANRLGVSPKTLTKHFQKLGEVSPSQFIKNRIVLEAKRQLLYTDNSVKNIAYHLGFNDAAYFSRFFSKSTGNSPNSFKKATQN